MCSNGSRPAACAEATSPKCKQVAQLQDVLGVPQLLQHVLFGHITDLEVVPNWGWAMREPCCHVVSFDYPTYEYCQQVFLLSTGSAGTLKRMESGTEGIEEFR